MAQQLSRSFGIGIARGPWYSGTALMLNLRSRPFDLLAARRAVAAAVDLGRLTANVQPAVPADRGYLHPASPWASNRVLYRFDAGAAQRVFAQLQLHAEVPVLAPDNDAVRLEAGRQVVLALMRAGVPARLVKTSAIALARAIGQDGSQPTFTAAIVSIPALASYDPDLLGRLFGAGPRRATLDTSGYHSAAFDALAEQVAAAPNRPTRWRAVQRLLERLARDAPAVPLFFSQGTFAYRRATYDGWVEVKGLGILDKTSFFPARPAPGPNPVGAGGGGARDHHSGGGGEPLDALSIVALIVLLSAVGLGAVALAHNWRSRR